MGTKCRAQRPAGRGPSQQVHKMNVKKLGAISAVFTLIVVPGSLKGNSVVPDSYLGHGAIKNYLFNNSTVRLTTLALSNRSKSYMAYPQVTLLKLSFFITLLIFAVKKYKQSQ